MTFIEWTNNRAEILAEDEASAAFMRGYKDYVRGEFSGGLFVGDPFGADDYFAGRQLASYEVGPVEIGEEMAA